MAHPKVKILSAHTWAGSAEPQNWDELASYQPQEDTRYPWQYKSASFTSKEKVWIKRSQHQIFALYHVAAAVYLFQKQESKSLIYHTAELHPRTQNKDDAKAQQVETNSRSKSEGKEAMRLIR